MDPVNGLTKVIEIIRQQASDRTSAANKSAPASESARRSIGTAPRHRSKAELKRLIVDRLGTIGPNPTPEMARQVFVSSVLVWEFGYEVLQDDDFGDLIEQVRASIEHEPRLKESLDRVMKKLV